MLAGPVVLLLLPMLAVVISYASPSAGDRRVFDLLAMTVLAFMFILLGFLVWALERRARG